MAFIKINPEGMLTVVNNLDERADGIATERKKINDSSRDNHDPVPSVDLATSPTSYPSFVDPSSGSGTLSACSQALYSLAEELRTRRQEAIDMNSSGITPADSNGVVSYYLPDPPEGTVDTEEYWNNTDTADNVKKYNSESAANGKTDATALNEALSSQNHKSSDGRTVDEILAEMGKHQDVPTYSGTFVNTYGVDDFIELPIRMGWNYTTYAGQQTTQYGKYATDTNAVNNANDKLAHILAAATKTSATPEEYDSWSDAIYQSVSANGHRGRISSLNTLLANDGVVYDTDTLVQLGDKLEDLPFDGAAASSTGNQISGYYSGTYDGWFYNEGRSDYGSSMDPLYGVTKAMGNNPDAAQQYLTPDGEMKNGKWVPGEQTNKRWKLLTERDWDSEVGLDGFTAAQAAASSYRSSENPETAGAATWLTGRSMEYAVDNVKTEDYTDTMKENLSVLVANSREEVASVATGSEPDGGNPGGLNLSDGSNTLSSLIYRVIDNKNAATTIGTALAEETSGNYTPTTAEDLKNKYKRTGAVYGYLDALGSERAAEVYGEKKKDSQESKDMVGTALTAFTTIAGAGLSGPAAPTLWSLGTSVTKPLALSQLDGSPTYEDPVAASRNALEAQAYAEASNRGWITEPGAYDPQRTSDENGETYSWFSSEDNTMELAKNPSDAQNEQVHNWANNLRNARTDEKSSAPLYPVATETFNNTDTAINTGINEGEARIASEDGQGGDSGTVTIKK